jgi:2-dehydro-3-deoxyphosphogluconate aldolase / (4S)-4-hydroxy-2-oxoglutarate aldolase
VKFIPTGGITPVNLPDYLQLPLVHACGGSWLVEKRMIAGEKFENITFRAREAVAIVQETRNSK